MFDTDTLIHLASIRSDALHYFIGRLAAMAQNDPELLKKMSAALADTQAYIAR